MTKCKFCMEQPDEEHITIPIRDLSFLVLNCKAAFGIYTVSKEEQERMEKIWNKYGPTIYYWSDGMFWEMTDEELATYKRRHKSYL